MVSLLATASICRKSTRGAAGPLASASASVDQKRSRHRLSAQHFTVQPIILIALTAQLNLTIPTPPHTESTPHGVSFRGGSRMQQHVQDNKTSEPQREPATPRLTTFRAAARRLLDAPAPMREKKPIDAEMVLCTVSVIQAGESQPGRSNC